MSDKNLTTFFKTLADEKRLKIIRMLSTSPDDSFFVTEIAEKLEVTQPAVSQHMRVLLSVGLVKKKRSGNRIYFTINSEVMRKYRVLSEQLFRSTFVKCPYSHKCSECHDREVCD